MVFVSVSRMRGWGNLSLRQPGTLGLSLLQGRSGSTLLCGVTAWITSSLLLPERGVAETSASAPHTTVAGPAGHADGYPSQPPMQTMGLGASFLYHNSPGSKTLVPPPPWMQTAPLSPFHRGSTVVDLRTVDHACVLKDSH